MLELEKVKFRKKKLPKRIGSREFPALYGFALEHIYF